MRHLPLALTLLAGCGGCNGSSPGADSGPPAPCVFTEVHRSEPGRIELDAGCARLVLDEIEVISDQPVSYEVFTDGTVLVPRIQAGAEGATVRAVHWSGTWEVDGAAEPVLWRQGYQSWSASGVFPLVPVERDAEGLPTFGGDDGVLEVVEETPWTSWWGGLVGRADGASVAVGSLSAETSKLVLAFDPDGSADLVWGGGDQQIVLGPNEDQTLDPLWMAAGPDPTALMDRWAEHVVTELERPPLRTDLPVGWATWYEHYEEIDEALIRANLAEAEAARDGGLPLDLIQIDDGWSPVWGDWTAAADFPSGMGPLAADIQAAGFTAGLWMAPFYVDRDAPIHAAHDDWWLRDREGNEVAWANRVVLDTTHPDALDWMVEQVGIHADEGYGYLKLDFLFAGAMDGQRYDPSVTGLQAYRQAMEAIRQRVGDDTWILACGAPLLPSVPWSDSFRTGPDIAFVAAPDPQRPMLRNQVRYTAARAFTNGRWWWMDPDNLILREPFDATGGTGAVAAQVVASGPWILGDDLPGLSVDRQQLALHPDAVALRGTRGIPADPLAFVSGFDTSPILETGDPDDQVPTSWTLASGETVLLNLSDVPITVDGPGGTELLGGAEAPAGPRELAPGAGELWRP